MNQPDATFVPKKLASQQSNGSTHDAKTSIPLPDRILADFDEAGDVAENGLRSPGDQTP
jgi:hypothetical protein